MLEELQTCGHVCRSQKRRCSSLTEEVMHLELAAQSYSYNMHDLSTTIDQNLKDINQKNQKILELEVSFHHAVLPRVALYTLM